MLIMHRTLGEFYSAVDTRDAGCANINLNSSVRLDQRAQLTASIET